MRARSCTVTVALAVLLCAAAASASAEEAASAPKQPQATMGSPAQPGQTMCPICGRANDPSADYATKASHTLARGVSNTLLGWTEVIQRPAEEVKSGGNVFNGIAQGVGHGLQRTLAGAGELLTFWTPKVNNNDYLRMADDCPLCMGRKVKKP